VRKTIVSEATPAGFVRIRLEPAGDLPVALVLEIPDEPLDSALNRITAAQGAGEADLLVRLPT
jgi:hypothetical protein